MTARILILEPDGNASSALRELLEDEGYEVFEVGEPDAPLEELLVQFEPDLVLADAGHPRHTSPALLAAASAASDAATPVVLMSINPSWRGTDVRVLAKPIDIDALFATIALLLRGRRPAAP